jgi:uncharacterized protein DUF1153
VKRKDKEPVCYVIGPQGTILTLADLPSANVKRWTVLRKAEIITAIRGGLLNLEDACERYSLTITELISWQSSVGPDCARTCGTDDARFGKRGNPDDEVALLFHQARLLNEQDF